MLRALRASGRDAVASIVPARLLVEGADGTLRSRIAIDGREVLPLSGPAHATTLLCNELGTWAQFESDQHGFRNAYARWRTPPEVALLGDSFTIGRCVDDDETIAAGLDRAFATLNLGMGGTGPLVQLAILREYGPLSRPRRVIWIHFENDLDAADLGLERRSPLLLQYLELGFSQNLVALRPGLDAEMRSLLAAEEIRIEPRSPTPLPRLVFPRSLRCADCASASSLSRARAAAALRAPRRSRSTSGSSNARARSQANGAARSPSHICRAMAASRLARQPTRRRIGC